MRVAVLGNCQARPLAASLEAAAPEVEVIGTVIVHLARDDEAEQTLAEVATADVVLAQRVADDYPVHFVRNVELRRHLGDRLLVWPNLFYRGYNPELAYLRGADRRPLQGPMGDYHLTTIHDAWLAGLPVDEAVARCKSVDFNREAYADVPDSSLSELRAREADADVTVSDHVEAHRWERRLFHTFNHPSRELLDLLAARVLDRLGLPRSASSDDSEPLGRWRLPLNPWVRAAYMPSFEDRPRFQGAGVDLSGAAPVVVNRPFVRRNYRELVAAYYEVYGSSR